MKEEEEGEEKRKENKEGRGRRAQNFGKKKTREREKIRQE